MHASSRFVLRSARVRKNTAPLIENCLMFVPEELRAWKIEVKSKKRKTIYRTPHILSSCNRQKDELSWYVAHFGMIQQTPVCYYKHNT